MQIAAAANLSLTNMAETDTLIEPCIRGAMMKFGLTQ